MNKILLSYRRNQLFSSPLLYTATRSRTYWKTIKLLNDSECWSAEQIKQWQLRHLIEIVEYAYCHVPFYRDLYSGVGYHLGDVRSFHDFTMLPYVTKDDIKNNGKVFLSDEFDSLPKVNSHTGGSTDKPMEFWVDTDALSRESAYYGWYWKKYGYQCGNRCIVLRGNRVEDITKDRLYYYDRLPNYKIFDSSYLDDQNMLALYDKQIREFHADTIFAYPSSLYSLAQNYLKAGIEPPKFKFVFLSSENIFEPQMETIQRVFGIEHIAYSYGHSEMCAIAFKYPDNNKLGFMPLYGYAELICEDEQSALYDSNNSAGIVGTSWSRVMPFIRYKTGDYAQVSNYHDDGYMQNCLSVERIDGRKQELIYTNEGNGIPLVIIAGAHIPSLSFVGDMQYYQRVPGELEVYVTSCGGNNNEISQQLLCQIKNDLEESLHHRISITVHQVGQVKKTSAGKRIMLLKDPLL